LTGEELAGSRCSSRWFRILDLLIDLLAMIVIVCQCGIDVGQGELREAIDDFVRRQATFRPEDDVLDPNPMSGDAESIGSR
jgi:hypothetical protein